MCEQYDETHRDIASVAQQDTALDAKRARPFGLVLGAAARDLLIGDVPVDGTLLRVDNNAVPVAHERDGPAELRLGRDVPDDVPVRGAAEAAVGDEGGLAGIGCEWSGS